MRSSASTLSRFLLACAAFRATAASAFSQTNTLPLSHAPLPDLSFSALRVMGALIFVLALFFGGVWLFRNWQRLMIQKGRAPKLSVLETKSLGNRHALYVVAYEQQRMMLAASPAGINLISHLPSADSEPLAAPPAPLFAQTLQQMLSRKG